MLRIPVLTIALLACSASALACEDFTAEDVEFFESKVRPLLVKNCYECHSTDANKLKAGLYVDSREGLVRGGDSGPAALPGRPEESLLIESVKYKSYEMPPDKKLTDREIAVLVKWVEMGLPWPKVTTDAGHFVAEGDIDWTKVRQSHWAWRPVYRPAVPTVEDSTHPIDALVATQRETDMAVAEPADAHVLARRIYLDLIGVPPPPENVVRFEAAAAVDRDAAVSSLIDELLALPQYGQRWARHWLDVARYSDGFGGFLDNSPLEDAWRYRDWVVHAFNNDLPFNRFIELQIAGDLVGDKYDAVATGFFAIGPLYRSDGGDPDSEAQAVGETLDDRVDTLTRGLLGVTGSCARCHDHKFDPIPQKDYYSLAGIFKNTEVHSLALSPEEDVKRFHEHKSAIADLNKKMKQLKSEDSSGDRAVLQKQLDELKSKAPMPIESAHALRDIGSKDMKIAVRGNLRKEGDLAPRRPLRVIAGPNPIPFSDGSGRKGLATSIIDPDNPLTGRVFVNRVWMHHFGDALVRTPDNFGTLGERPTHPELLDWLVSEFVANGWSIKRLHRLIMTSKTYQLSSQFIESSFHSDSDNRKLWRMSPRRLDVESWRDSLLSVTGELDVTAGGPPIDDIMGSTRRTLYSRVSRSGDVFPSDRFLRNFDFPSMRATLGKRPSSIVPQQFLFLMNSPFMFDRAKALVKRLKGMGQTDEGRIRQAYRLLLSRPPSESERRIGVEFLTITRGTDDDSPWLQYAQALLSSNEFMHVR